MTAPPGGPGETAAVYRLCSLFKAHPELHYNSITVRENGNVEVSCTETHGVLMNWSRAVPQHVHRTALVPTAYGADEADVLQAEGMTITVRRPFAIGGQS